MPNGKSRPVIVKFVRYNTRNLVFKNKKNLKDQELENLTAKRMKKNYKPQADLSSSEKIFAGN